RPGRGPRPARRAVPILGTALWYLAPRASLARWSAGAAYSPARRRVGIVGGCFMSPSQASTASALAVDAVDVLTAASARAGRGANASFPRSDAVAAIVQLALAEDVGRGDITTEATVAVDATATAEILQKQAGVLCGLPVVEAVFAAV